MKCIYLQLNIEGTFAVRYIHTLMPKCIVNIFRYTSAKASDINYPFKDEKSA